MSEKHALICWPVAAGEPKARSFVSECDECGCAVWRAYSSPDTDVVFCVDCATTQIKAAKERGQDVEFEKPTKEQEEEAKWWFMNFGKD